MVSGLFLLSMKVANATFIRQCVTLRGHARFYTLVAGATIYTRISHTYSRVGSGKLNRIYIQSEGYIHTSSGLPTFSFGKERNPITLKAAFLFFDGTLYHQDRMNREIPIGSGRKIVNNVKSEKNENPGTEINEY